MIWVEMYCRKQLGGKLGTSLQIDLGVNTVGDLLQFSEEKLQEYFGINTGSYSIAFRWNVLFYRNDDILSKCFQVFPNFLTTSDMLIILKSIAHLSDNEHNMSSWSSSTCFPKTNWKRRENRKKNDFLYSVMYLDFCKCVCVSSVEGFALVNGLGNSTDETFWGMCYRRKPQG